MAQPETSGRREPGSEEWQRPWETSRDRSTFALGFAAALVTDVFVDLSRTLLLALRLGSVQNPPAYSSDATIRPGDLYFLHLMMHGAHDAAIKAMCSLGIRWRQLLQRFLWLGSGALLVLLLVVHLAFVNPSTQLSASRNLSALLETYCSQEATWLLHLELLETWTRPTNWTEIGEEENATLVNILKRLGDLAHLGYEAAFPRPSYELASDSSWLAVRSRNLRRGQVSTHHLQLSTENASLFGPRWARTLQSTLGLYDIYVLHALSPLSPCEGRLFVWVASGSAPLRLSPAGGGVLVSVVQTLAFMSSLAVACVLFSSFLRSFLVLSMRTYVNNRFCLLQLQRFAFISQAMRRVNRAPASMLLELWVATSASALLLLWILLEAGQRSLVWPLWILCYAWSEFWGLAHVRSQQSRWIFPRAVGLVNLGAAVYAFCWPNGPRWLLLCCVLWFHAALMFTLLSNFDCCFSLPPQPPHQLFVSSMLLPAVPLSRDAKGKEERTD